jgi:hypothetical protein
MPDSYDVTTPLGQQWVDTPEEVRAEIDRYVQQPDASLVHVTVVKLRDTGERTGVGEPLAPQNFWP